jgi:transposase
MKNKDNSKRRKSGSLPRKRLRLDDPAPASSKPRERVKVIEPGVPATTRNVIDIIRQIKSGSLNPSDLSKIERRMCIKHLGAEGLAVPEIAQVLGVSDRTVARDRKSIHEGQALEHDPRMASRMAGRLVNEAEVVMQRLRRISRDRETPPAIRVDVEKTCFGVLVGLTERLQSLGYLPTAAQRIEADLRHESVMVPTHKEIKLELDRLEVIAEESSDVQVIKSLKKLRGTATRARVVERMGDVEVSLRSGGHDDAA